MRQQWMSMPFADAFIPQLEHARQELDVRIKRDLAPNACQPASAFIDRLQDWLAGLLSARATPTLMAEFRCSPYYGQGSADAPQTTWYAAFVSGLLNDSWQSLYQAYPLLEQALLQVSRQWLDYCWKLLSAVTEGSWRQIVPTLSDEPATVVDVVGLDVLSGHDLDCSRAVLQIRLSTGDLLVYKNRDLNIEMKLFHLMRELNGQSVPHLKVMPFYIPRYVNGPDFSWIEHITQQPCQTEGEVQAYYYRSGCLLGLAYLLNIADLYCQNLVAHRDYPVVIDAESVLALPGNSQVLDSLMLPDWYLSRSGRLVSYAALAAETSTVAPWPQQKVHHVNTDHMYLAWHYQEGVSAAAVHLGHELIYSFHYSEAVVQGFCDMYRMVLSQRTHWQKTIAEQFRTGSHRFLVRQASAYRSYLMALEHPDVLAGKTAAESVQLDDQSLLPGIPSHPDLFELEMAALTRHAIPRLYFSILSGGLSDPESSSRLNVQDLGRRTALENFLQKCDRLSLPDLTRQVELIRQSFDRHRNYYQKGKFY